MSTRCQIKITYLNQSVLLYHHWDGYPEGVGLDIIKRQKRLKTWVLLSPGLSAVSLPRCSISPNQESDDTMHRTLSLTQTQVPARPFLP